MPTKGLDTLPRTERFAKLDWPAAGMTLRLASALVTRYSCFLFRVLPDRNLLLSSKSLVRRPPSYAPVSDGPSAAPSRPPTNFGRTPPTNLYRPPGPAPLTD